MMKVCARCGEEKPLDEYHQAGINAYGNKRYKSRCKDCCSIEGRYYREKNKEILKQKRDELRIGVVVDICAEMREAAQMANQAFPLLSPAYWDVEAAKRAHEELGLVW